MTWLTQELSRLLRHYRKKARLSLNELVQRLKLSAKAGKSYLSRLERGKIKNPHLHTVLTYLRACNVSWQDFFKALELRAQYLESARVIRKLGQTQTLISEPKLYRVSRKYQASLNRATINNDEDLTLTRQLVNLYLAQAQIPQELFKVYINFCDELIKQRLKYFSVNKITYGPWLKLGAQLRHLKRIRQLILETRGTTKSHRPPGKPPSPELQTRMHYRYMEYFANITNIEAQVHRLLDRFAVPLVLYQRYKSFTRAVYKVLTKKPTAKNLSLKRALAALHNKYTADGLNQKILLKITKLVRKNLPALDA
ncbi:MAG: helix-turn-helix transcriptional regulator [candidate division WOR-3 bacterium]